MFQWLCAGLFLQPPLPHAAGSRSCPFVGMFTSLRLLGVQLSSGETVPGDVSTGNTDGGPVGASGKDRRASGERGRDGQADISGGVIAVPMAAH